MISDPLKREEEGGEGGGITYHMMDKVVQGRK